MQRTVSITTLQINMQGTPPGGAAPILAQQMVQLQDDSGTVISQQANVMPLIASDFTAELLTTINARLALVGIALSKI